MKWQEELEWLEANKVPPVDYVEFHRRQERIKRIAFAATKRAMELEPICRELTETVHEFLYKYSDCNYRQWKERRDRAVAMLRRAKEVLGDVGD